jgi:hypothetical protein
MGMQMTGLGDQSNVGAERREMHRMLSDLGPVTQWWYMLKIRLRFSQQGKRFYFCRRVYH